MRNNYWKIRLCPYLLLWESMKSLARLKRELSPTEECVFCFQRDTAQRAMFECKRFGWKMRILEETMRLPFETGTVVVAM